MPAVFSAMPTGPTAQPVAAQRGDGCGAASVTSNVSMATGVGSVAGILSVHPGEVGTPVRGGGGGGGSRGSGRPWNKAMLRKMLLKRAKSKAQRREVLKLLADPNWYQTLGLPPLTNAHSLREWVTSHCQSQQQADAARSLTKLVTDNIEKHTGAKAFRTAGSTARGTSEKQKVDVDLAAFCPNAASVKTMKDLLGPELSKRVEWERTRFADHKHDDGSHSRRIFASLVFKNQPKLPVDVALFSNQRDFDRQGEVLNKIQSELHFRPGAAELAVAMKGVLRHGYGGHVAENFRMRAGAPGIAIELAALHAGRRMNDCSEVTPQLLAEGLRTFATPSAALKADWGHPVSDFDTKSAAFEEARYGAKLLGRAIMY